MTRSDPVKIILKAKVKCKNQCIFFQKLDFDHFILLLYASQ